MTGPTFRVGLSVKEKKWGRSGYNKDIVHVNYETTHGKPDVGVDHTDSGGREESRSSRDLGSDYSGEGVAMVREGSKRTASGVSDGKVFLYETLC